MDETLEKKENNKNEKESIKNKIKQQEIESLKNRSSTNFQFKQKYSFTRAGKTKKG